jgi:asparagine synthase (glutamine-hydrolysing)
MAGWLAVWSKEGSVPDADLWSRSVRVAVRYGGVIQEYRQGRAAFAAWRRNSGEFSQSGTIRASKQAHLAWVGQCIEDSGDSTNQAISLLSERNFSDNAIAGLNGPFAAAVINEQPFEVRIFTDRQRHYPVYLHIGNGVTVASTELRCVRSWLPRAELRRDSFDMLLRCGELIDRMTLLEGVEILPPGTVLVDIGNGPTDRRYWSMRSDGISAPRLAKSAENLAERIKVAVRRIEAVSPRLGITLSGGLDSRIILDLCAHPEDVPSFTWGLPGCRDIVYASEFAAAVGSCHTVKHWDPSTFPPLWSRGVDLTAGSCGIESMFMLPFVPLLASKCDVVLNGLAGDVLLGGNWLKYSWLSEADINALGLALWRWRVSEEVDRLADRLIGSRSDSSSARARWVDSIAARDGARPIERMNDWLLENRIFRTTNCGTMLLRGGVESHSPFFDRDFIDAMASVRQDDKFKHRLYLGMMNRVAPRAASIPWQRTNVAPDRGYHANLAAMAFHRLAERAAKFLGIDVFRDLPVADVAGWLRGPWRQQVEQMLLGGRLVRQGLVDADVLGEILDGHMDGRDHTRQLSVLIATEVFCHKIIGEAEGT